MPDPVSATDPVQALIDRARSPRFADNPYGLAQELAHALEAEREWLRRLEGVHERFVAGSQLAIRERDERIAALEAGLREAMPQLTRGDSWSKANDLLKGQRR